MKAHESATAFAERVSRPVAAPKPQGGVTGTYRAENATKRRNGALRGDFEHHSFDTAARRHYDHDAIQARRYTGGLVILAYATVAAVMYGLYEMLAPLR